MPNTIYTEQPKVTIYQKSVFGMDKIEGELLEVGEQPYAQYPLAPYFVFIKHRGRIKLKQVLTYKPVLLILEGYNHLEPESPFAPEEIRRNELGIVKISKSRYGCYDDRYVTDFAERIKQYINEIQVNVLINYNVL